MLMSAYDTQCHVHVGPKPPSLHGKFRGVWMMSVTANVCHDNPVNYRKVTMVLSA